MDDSYKTIVTNNTCINNNIAGIMCRYSNSTIIKDNYIYNNNGYIGIYISHSLSTSVLNNTSTSNANSLSVQNSSYTEIVSNKFYVTGVDIRETEDKTNYLLYTFEDNTVNDLILGYFKEPKNVKFTEPIFGQIIIVYGNKITIKNQNSEMGFIGVTLKSCKSIMIKDLKIINTPEVSPAWGIWIYGSENIEINNIVCNNRYGGIILQNTNNSIIKSSLCEGGSSSGIWLQSSHNNYLVNNTCSNNGLTGIRLYLSDMCNIMFNHLENNGIPGQVNLGLVLEVGSDFNTIHHNIFISDVADGTPQAADDSQNNTWYDIKTKEGNWWSDYDGSGSYAIYGVSNSTDLYPLSEIPIYTEPNYFAIYFSVILILPIAVTVVIQIVSKRKSVT